MSNPQPPDSKDQKQDTKDLKRERMLCFIRDTLVERAHGLRTGFETNDLLWSRSEEGKEQLKRVVAIEAAADVFTHIVGEWQNPDEKRPEWVKIIAKQAMATFVEAFQVN
jgi:hypothetical protein